MVPDRRGRAPPLLRERAAGGDEGGGRAGRYGRRHVGGVLSMELWVEGEVPRGPWDAGHMMGPWVETHGYHIRSLRDRTGLPEPRSGSLSVDVECIPRPTGGVEFNAGSVATS